MGAAWERNFAADMGLRGFMLVSRKTLSLLVAAGLTAPTAVAHAQERQATLDAGAVSIGGKGPVFRFSERLKPFADANSPVIGRMEVTRPSNLTVRTPSSTADLGFIEYSIGSGTAVVSRRFPLRRVRTLGKSYFLLADAFGANVVLSTKYRRRFLTAALPDGAFGVNFSFSGAGARMLDFRGCSDATFEGRFTRSRTVDRGSITVPSKFLKSAGFC